MSALGQKQTFAVQKGMSALPPKADIPSCLKSGHGWASGLFAKRFGLRQELCRIPSIVELMPFSSLVGLPITTARLERYFGCLC